MQPTPLAFLVNPGTIHPSVDARVVLTFLSAAFWDATRAFMLLAVLSCFAGVVLGLSAFTNGTKNRRVRTGGIALVLSGNTHAYTHTHTHTHTQTHTHAY